MGRPLWDERVEGAGIEEGVSGERTGSKKLPGVKKN
jgi:hypothetical protein